MGRKRLTVCKNGHEMTKENTYIYISNGKPQRLCWTCKRDREKRWYDKYRSDKPKGECVKGHKIVGENVIVRAEKDRKNVRIRCKICFDETKKKQHMSVKIKKFLLLLEYYETHHCIDCGNSDYRVLDFHHRDPETKRYNVSNILAGAYKWETVLNEINKCDVLCANCHRIRTAEQRNYYSFYYESL